ncbi:MAG TPA: tetratricopeptide repeat protein [Actinocrinis sp.]
MNVAGLVVQLAQRGIHRRSASIADRLSGYYMMRVNVIGLQTVAQAFQRAATADGDLTMLASAALQDGMLKDLLLDIETATARLTEAAALAGRAGWTAGEAVSLNNAARTLWMSGQVEAAIERLEQALELNRRSGRTAGEAVTVANLGVAHLELAGDGGPGGPAHLAEAMRLLNEGLVLHRRIDDRRNEADTLRRLAEAHRELGDDRRAAELARQAMRLAVESGDLRFELSARSTLATVLARLGQTREGLDEHRVALDKARQSGNLRLEAETLLDAAETYIRLGRPDDASITVQDALAVAVQIGSRPLVRRALRVRGQLEAESPDPSRVAPAETSP